MPKPPDPVDVIAWTCTICLTSMIIMLAALALKYGFVLLLR